MTPLPRHFVYLVLATGLAMAAFSFVHEAAAQTGGDFVAIVEIDGVFDPVTADYLEGRLDAAQDQGAHAVILQIDTPGGLDVSVRDIVDDIVESDVPIVVWIAPRGARAASVGTFLTYAAHLAYMAQATEVGPATPVNLARADTSQGADVSTTTLLRDLATTNNRDPSWAESSIRDAALIGAAEAEQTGAVNGVASSLDELLQELDGQVVTTKATSEVTLETWDESVGTPSVTIRFQEMDPFEKLLHFAINPEFAYLLVLIGVFGIIFELYNPGIGLAGVLGALSLVLGFYGLSVLPTNWLGVALIAAAVVFFIVDLQTAGLGAWTIGGSAALVGGALLLFSEADRELRLSSLTIAISLILTLIFFFSVMTAALRVRLRRPITGEEGLVGAVAEAYTDIAPEGTVLTKGTRWRARTMETGIAAGSKVQVKAMEGLVLLVEPLHDDTPEGSTEEQVGDGATASVPVGPNDKEV